MISRLHRSINTASYSQPARVAIKVTSAIQIGSGWLAVNGHLSKLGVLGVLT